MGKDGRRHVPFVYVACIFGMLKQREIFVQVLPSLIHWLGRLARLPDLRLLGESSTRLDPSPIQGFEKRQL
jgi:hypothetical protein